MNDPLFHHALGDFDYGLRASKFGVSSVVVPGVLGECDDHEDLAHGVILKQLYTSDSNYFIVLWLIILSYFLGTIKGTMALCRLIFIFLRFIYVHFAHGFG